MSKPTVFISYSHADEAWKDRLRPQLGVLEQAGRIVLWDDRRIDAGATWYPELERAMANAAVAVCLISPDYLASDFCVKEEIPYLLQRRARDGMILIPVLLRPCFWQAAEWLKPIQMLPADGRSVAHDYRDDWDAPFAEVAGRVFEIVEDPAYRPPAAPPPRWAPPEKVDISRLPVTGAELFGRDRELALLDEAWERGIANVVGLVGWGGVGKSTLVNKWLERLQADNYRGAARVFGWSFYSQGTGERVTSADQFIATALRWFGDRDPAAGSPWDKGERLAALVRAQKNLLILDGLEPLQSDTGFERGRVKDPGLAVLLAELARDNPGLCVITTREAVADLAPFARTARQENLERLSPQAGRALLRIGGVQGTDAELEAASAAFGNHALAVTLLASYLRDVPGHPAARGREIPDLDATEERGKHPRRVMAAFAGRFGAGPGVELLQLLGLFDRPAELAAIAAVRAAPAIPGLTSQLSGMGEAAWLRLLARLRQTKLIAAESRHRPDVLDAHPLVREHFGEQLRGANAAAWAAAHGRLYEHYRQAAAERPDTLEGMAPLYAAVAHGCAAGRHQDALDEVYWRRIQRGEEFYATRKLGAFGAELAALAGFFAADPPWRRPVAGLTEADKAFVLSVAGFRLRALGRLAEAMAPMAAGLEADIALKDWKNAARQAGNLSELALTAGDLPAALRYAEQSVELADRSGDAFQRMVNRTALADALHQAGRLAEAAARFREAEEMQRALQPEYPLLYSLPGYRYCDLLLAQGQAEEVLRRAAQTIEWEEGRLLDIALDHLALGRGHLMLALASTSDVIARSTLSGVSRPLADGVEGRGEAIPPMRGGLLRRSAARNDDALARAAAELDQAVTGLRQAGQQDEMPRGLLARAALRRVTADFDRARRDLDEALLIATRGGMRLHEADCHLEYGRLSLATGDAAGAREHCAVASRMVSEMGYGRREREAAELEKALGGGG
jgi:tetratricopeptide (TPR) repeat protein